MTRNRLKTSFISLPAAVLALLVSPGGSRQAFGQTAPAYPELYRDPPRTDQLTPADLPNLGRQVMLEATSMFVHVRSELSDSPEAFRLLDQIRALWNEADAFTAAVSSGGLGKSRQSRPARSRIPTWRRPSSGFAERSACLPGNAPRAALNLQAMSRPMAVIGPLLRQGLRADGDDSGDRGRAETAEPGHPSYRGPDHRPSDSGSARRACQERVHEPLPPRSTGELDVLSQLCLGLARIAVPLSDDRDIISSVRPLRSQAQRIDLEARNGRFPGFGARPVEHDQGSDRRHRRPAISSLARLIMRPSREAPVREAGAIASVEQAARAIDGFLQNDPSGATTRAAENGLVEADARRLQSRLFMLRQQLLGRDAFPSISRAILDVKDGSGPVRGPCQDRVNAAGRKISIVAPEHRSRHGRRGDAPATAHGRDQGLARVHSTGKLLIPRGSSVNRRVHPELARCSSQSARPDIVDRVDEDRNPRGLELGEPFGLEGLCRRSPAVGDRLGPERARRGVIGLGPHDPGHILHRAEQGSPREDAPGDREQARDHRERSVREPGQARGDRSSIATPGSRSRSGRSHRGRPRSVRADSRETT